MTNPTNIFNFVAHDILQYVLNPFLEPIERAAFNTVLEPTERVFKRFPKDFAEKHAVKIAYAAQKRHADRINFWTESANNVPDDSWKQYAAHGVDAIGQYAEFFTKPVAAPLFKYRSERNHAARITSELTGALHKDSMYETFMIEEIRVKIYYAVGVINSLKSEKHFMLT